MNSGVRLLALYLPQFHPIPENDEWWGRGFTEWTNVAKARPLFPGHYQPHVPADLGFYDLRVPETREAQAELARHYGVAGFCYYHYWFAGHLVLQRPLEEVVASGRPDFPFCVCWANQTWTGIWHGAPDRILIEQTYPGEEDHRAHFRYLLPAFADPRYVRVQGKPLMMIYRPLDIPEPRRAMDLWRQLAVEAGLGGLYIIGVHEDAAWNPRPFGMDAMTCQRMPERRGWVSRRQPLRWSRQRLAEIRGVPTCYTFESQVPALMPQVTAGIASHPMVLHAWDNSPRSGADGVVLTDPRPDLFARLLRRAIDLATQAPDDAQLVFLKSWNEWAEGNHLEPDLRYGHAYLEVIREESQGALSRREAAGTAALDSAGFASS